MNRNTTAKRNGRTRLTRGLRAAAAVALTAALVGSCASGDTTEGPRGVDLNDLQEGYLGQDSPGDPVEGGTLTMAGFAEPSSLDPAVTIAAVTTGGVELLNLYDSLMRYDVGTQEFEPQLAESLESQDNVVWTLRLREGVTFSNGVPLDAEAVKLSQERYASMPAPEAALWNTNVESVEVTDDRTVVYTLARPWAQFPGILTTGPGMIVTPGTGAGDDFEPIGAGPFVLDAWRPAEAITMTARADYWDGVPRLEGVRFVYLQDTVTSLDSLARGEVDLAFAREPDLLEEQFKKDPGGYVNMTAASQVALINAEDGRPGADVRVRRAMQLALDSDLIAKRAFKGVGGGSPTLFPDYSRWHAETQGLAHDPEEARRLLEEAKADGFDGRISYLARTGPSSGEAAIAVKALLESVGFEVELDMVRTVSDQINKIMVDRNYDVAAWGHSFREADPIPKMFSTMHSSGTQLYGAHTSPEMDALLDSFQTAPTLEEQQEIMDRIQAQVNEEVPFLVYGPYAEVVLWNDDVREVVGTANSMVLFAKAWKS